MTDYSIIAIPRLEPFLRQYYAKSPSELLAQVLADDPAHPLTSEEIERMAYELTPSERQFLERKLPPSHPVMLALSEIDRLPLPSGHRILR